MTKTKSQRKAAEGPTSAIGSLTPDSHSLGGPINSRCQGMTGNDGGATRPSDLCYAENPSSVKPGQSVFSPISPPFSISPPNVSPNNPLNVGTLNVSTLRGKMAQVLKLAEQFECHILCLQETRLGEDNMLSAVHAARRAGWHFVGSPCSFNAHGAPNSGVGVLSRWPIDLKKLPEQNQGILKQNSARWQVLRVHRPHQRPFDLVNLYLHASDKASACELADSLFRVIQKSGEDCLFIGDWNNTPEQPPAVGPLQNGSLHLADEVAGSSCINSPTRQDGRHIDYALHSFRLVPHSRSQYSGVADHDLVLYQFSMCEIEASRFVAPARNLLEVHQVSSETFLEHFPLQEFQDHLGNHDVQSAWNLLSNSAEHVLKPATGRPRCKIPSPTEPAKAPTKPDKLQSMTERKLRRTLRRVLENQRDANAPWSLYRKICRDIHNLSRQFPELSEVSATDDAIATILQDCITKEQVHSQEARLQRWKHKMNEDEQALIRWVKGADDHINSSDDPSVPIHPQQKAEFYRNYWSGIWDPVESTNNADDILQYLHWVPQEGFACPSIVFQADLLRKLTKRAVGTAAGSDGWAAKHWLLLPDIFFMALAQLWQCVLSSGKLPFQWTHVRTVLIPKDVGLRPISVAALAWRIGMGAIIQQLTPWINLWAPPELVGGLKHRCAAFSHDALHGALQNPIVYGAKLDVSKCFDHVNILQAILVWHSFGAPPQVCTLLKNFYQDLTKTMEWQRCTALNSIKCSRGLLQGCPSSCALLAGLMSVWTFSIKFAAPSIAASIFVDDRTLWSFDLHSLDLALQVTHQFDRVCGFRLNESKSAFFFKGSRQRLKEFSSWNQSSNKNWPICKQFKLLGVYYNLTAARRTPVDLAVEHKVQARLRRLKTATHKQFIKRKLTRSLVLSLFNHTGAWSTLPVDRIFRWQNLIELAVLGSRPTQRSRFLVWALRLGPQLDPEFDLDSKVIHHLLWLLQQRVKDCNSSIQISQLGLSEIPILPPRCQEVFSKWHWEHISFSHFLTPFGELDLLSHGEHAVRQIMRLSWQHALSLKEPRIIADNPDLSSKALVLDTHLAWLKSGHQQQINTALGAANDAYKMNKKFEKVVFCSCGRPSPSRHHFTWHCPDRPVPEDLTRPVTVAEEKLLIRALDKPPSVSAMPMCQRALNQLTDHLRTLPDQTVIACDGSMISKCGQARAAWAVATAHACFGAPSPGLDQHIHSAEAWAVLVALRAADSSNLSCNIISDCQSVLQKAWRVRAGGALPRFAPGLWKEISFLSPHSMLHFVPSHGKKLSWKPPGQFHESLWRHLNSLADSKANILARRQFQHLLAFCRDFESAGRWTHQSLMRQMMIITAFEKQLASQTASS